MLPLSWLLALSIPQTPSAPFFLQDCKVAVAQIYAVLGTDEVTMDRLTDELYRELAKPSHRLKEESNLATISADLKATVDSLLIRRGHPSPKNELSQWLYAEAVGGFVRMNVRYDTGMLERSDRYELNQSYSVLSRRPATATCGGFARLGIMLARHLGVKAWHMGGANRGWGLIQTNKDTHGWDVFEIGGLLIPSDNVWQIDDKDLHGLRGKTKEWEVMPRRREAWELFLARHYATYWIDVPADEKGCEERPFEIDPLRTSPFEKWGQKDTNYMVEAERRMERLEAQRHTKVARG